jgi:hypothetical protein
MRRYQLFVDAPGDEWFEYRPSTRRSESIEASLREVGDTRGKMKAKKIRQGEDVIADAAAIGVVGPNAQVGFVVEKPVDDVGSLAGGWDRDRVVRRLTGGEVGIEKCGSSTLVMSVDRSDGFPRAGGREVLPVRARHVGSPEQCGERLTLLGVDKNRKGAAIGFLA